ncbi:hypothetical protein C5L38_35485 (plasmid) [Streptomyces sp. WAC00288]|nr:hypothetical protein [Streptomyces sp. WAC00288]AVI00339.1 hypothetical protein C5L38_35485 [Streptomyces sp. WAC00288]
MLHDRGWTADLHILVRTQTFGEPDWSEVDSDWTFEAGVPALDQKSVQPALIGIEGEIGETILVTLPCPIDFAEPCPDHRPGVLEFPLTHQGLDILETTLPAIEAVRLDTGELAACRTDGKCSQTAKATEAAAH